MKEYRVLSLGDGKYIQIKFEYDGIVYDMYDSNNEHIEEFGYDLYEETVIPSYLQHKEKPST